MNKLALYLTEYRIRQVDFASRIGATQSTVSRLVSGTATPSLDLAVRIERATGGAVPATSWIEMGAQPQGDAA